MMADSNDQLIRLLNTKGVLNADTSEAAFRVFSTIKFLLEQFNQKLKQSNLIDKRIKVQYADRGTFEAELKIADDMLVFILHANTFVFDHSHPLWKSSYVELEPTRGTCAMISVYNFLSDSFTFDRKEDIGLLIARIFINKEGHFFVEGKRQLGILFNDYENMVADESSLSTLLEACLIYSLEIDVLVPPFDAMKQLSVFEALAYNIQSAISASKRLGFKFQKDTDIEG